MRPIAPILLMLLAACSLGPVVREPTAQPPTVALLPTLMPTPTGAPPEVPDTGWLPGGPGAELRRLRVSLADRQAPVSVVRLDPAMVRLRVGYSPAAP
ncbi:MAG: hypothetical protein HGA45_40560, partial [Chloroflexales bacterium]|nr:hypothetical protein [Chloroflexales bacterium]